MTVDYEKLARSFEPKLRKAFLASIADIRSTTILGRLEEAIRGGRIEEVLEVLDLDPTFFGPLQEAYRQTFNDVGATAVAEFSAARGTGRVVARWNMNNPRAAGYAQMEGARLVENIARETREGIAQMVSNSYSEGRAPLEIARDIVGRVNKQTGRREGGMIGLHEKQVEYVTNMREELSRVPPRLSDYTKRAARDKRADRTIAKAMREGKALTPAQIDKIITRYQENLIKVRAEAIARTESHNATSRAQYEGMQQQIDAGRIKAEHVKKVWSSTGDGRTRRHHSHLDGQSIGWNEYFQGVGPNSLMLHPGDREHGASGADIINCRCHMYIRIDRYARLREMERAGG